MIKELVIASHNAGKVKEIGELIAPFKIPVLSATQANIDEPEETGDSFSENASLKALNASEKSGKPSLADDSGLVVPAIGGSPGIYSARWAGPDKDFTVAFKRIEQELEMKTPGIKNADAYFICVLALSLQDGMHVFEGRIDGTLTFPPRGMKGFGYDPIFIPKGYDITFGEMDPVKKNAISHRANAFDKFSAFLKDMK
jgi:XTP/dITP diphosphohydrolase